MNWLDVVIVTMLFGFVAAAYSAGLIREIITLLSVIVGIVLAGLLYTNLAGDVLVFLDNEGAARAIAFLLLFGSVYLFGQIAAYVFKRGAQLFMLGMMDSIGGGFFGFFKGIFVVQMLLIVFAAYPSLGMSGAVDGSALGKFFVDDISFLTWILPAEFDDRLADFLLGNGS